MVSLSLAGRRVLSQQLGIQGIPRAVILPVALGNL